jgi:hypothetical protein
MEPDAAPNATTTRHPGSIILAAVAGLAVTGLVIGCIQPGYVPPPGAIPYTPGEPASNLFRPPAQSPTVGGLSITPLRSDQADAFPWPPASPLRRWRYIVLHHTASNSGSVESIDAAHQQRTDGEGNNWRGIGYHFVIGNGNGIPDGAIEPTFRWQDQSAGAHAGVSEYNEFGVGICLVGNFEEGPPTPKQLAAVKRLVAALKGRCGIDTAGVLKHGDLKTTACPGKFFPHDEVAATPADLALAPRGRMRR